MIILCVYFNCIIILICCVQVLFINGIDVSGMLHDHVVNLIRASRDSRVGELVLTVRPNGIAYQCVYIMNMCVHNLYVY